MTFKIDKDKVQNLYQDIKNQNLADQQIFWNKNNHQLILAAVSDQRLLFSNNELQDILKQMKQAIHPIGFLQRKIVVRANQVSQHDINYQNNLLSIYQQKPGWTLMSPIDRDYFIKGIYHHYISYKEWKQYFPNLKFRRQRSLKAVF